MRGLFGRKREEMWRQLTAEIGGDYIPSTFWKRDKVVASQGEWTITLDTFYNAGNKMEYTRMRAPYLNPDNFRFTVYRRGFFADIAKAFGMQDVEVGYPDFDRDFIIKGSDEAKLRALFANRKIRELLADHKHVHFSVADKVESAKGEMPGHADELCFTVIGIITELDRLKQLFELFAETLDQLCKIGSAYGAPPNLDSRMGRA